MTKNKNEDANAQNQITIVTSLNRTPEGFFPELPILKLKCLIYKFLCQKRYIKTKNKIDYLIQGKGKKIIGHKALLLSLLRGMDELGIEYSYNPGINKIGPYVFLAWSNPDEFAELVRLKRKGQIKKIICLPTFYRDDTDFLYNVIKTPETDTFLVASEWVKQSWLQTFGAQYEQKIKVWASGVKELPYEDKNISHKILFYVKGKGKGINKKILDLFKKHHIQYDVIVYGKYDFNTYIRELKQADLVVFDNDAETQGLAYAEAWMCNVPTIVNGDFLNNAKGDFAQTAPYLTDKAGKFYNSYEELDKILSEYQHDAAMFLNRFSPRQYALDNFSDKKSAEMLCAFLD